VSVRQVSSLWGAIKKPSVASSWHFISTYGVVKFIQFSPLKRRIQSDSLPEVLNILKYFEVCTSPSFWCSTLKWVVSASLCMVNYSVHCSAAREYCKVSLTSQIFKKYCVG